ncbi:MAG: hypothetical protein ABR535_04765 [Pyrinomonadaceae bacterium]
MKKLSLIYLGIFLLFPAIVSSQRIDPNEVIEKHLTSIATTEKRSAVKNQMFVGNAEFTFKGGAQVISGKALLLSSGAKSL